MTLSRYSAGLGIVPAMAKYDAEQRRRALRAFMKERGLSVLGWAKRAGISEGGLRDFLSGRNATLTDRTYAALAQAVDTTVDVLRGDSLPPAEIPLWGHAGAGDAVHPFDGEERTPLEMVEAPPGLRDGGALIVKGDSMLPRWADGDVLFFETAQRPPSEMLNRICVLRVKNGPYLVKRLTPGTRRGRYHLVSVNPAMPVLKDQAVEWAAAIAWTRHDGQN